jgi:transcription termination factor NusB
MGAGILPATIHKGQLYFLFGKENQYEDSAPGFSDFGGGTDNGETYLQTAIREGGEELTGFLGSDADLKKILKKHGTYNIDHRSLNNTHKIYRMHIFPMEYDPKLVFYYNNNQRFLQKRLDPNVIKDSKIFEKAEIRWISVNEIMKMKSEFRSYFQNIVDQIHSQKTDIRKFVENALKKVSKKNRTLKKR